MYKAVLSYKGTRYFGWQKTNMGPSIQDTVEQALLRVTQEPTAVAAASRTDRGVHAMGQIVQFALREQWEPAKLLAALNGVLPCDIRMLHIERKEFHPTLDAVQKEYFYKVSTEEVQDPHDRLFSWHVYYPIDDYKIKKGCQELSGTHDFSAFCNYKKEGRGNPVCHLESILFDGTAFHIRGDRFLYKMVRNLVGTLIYIGAGKLGSAKEILSSKDRKRAGITAPAHGLYLHQVFYPVT